MDNKVFFQTKTSYNFEQSSTYRVSSKGNKKGVVKQFDQTQKILNKNIIIKIDVEGHEEEVLQGMIKTLKQNSILLQVEIFSKNFKKVNGFLLKEKFKFIMKIESDHFYIKN